MYISSTFPSNSIHYLKKQGVCIPTTNEGEYEVHVDVWTQEFTVHDLNEKSPIYLQSEKPYS
jgi:hypothetical protein